MSNVQPYTDAQGQKNWHGTEDFLFSLCRKPTCVLIHSANSPQQSATDTGHWKDAVNPTRCKCEIFRPTLETLMLKEILRKGGLPRCPPSSSKQQLLETTFPTQLPQVLPIVGAGYTELHRATQSYTELHRELHRATDPLTRKV